METVNPREVTTLRTTSTPPQQCPSGMPIEKYRAFLDVNPVSLPDRTWPDKRITHAPRWLSTDLRDGNQSLIEPMNPAKKRRMFDLLVGMGFKEIEIGFPAASQLDFDFVRQLVEQDAVPEDVCLSVLVQAREDLIERTIDAIAGLPRATVHLYNATSPLFRRVVFGNDKEQTKELARRGTELVVNIAEKRLQGDTIFGFEYSPEIFIDTELDFALEVCETVMDVWQPQDGREIILNLPTTVERATPNVYADMIEWMSRHLSRREFIALSAHPHNDRGTGIATAELAMLAGIDRVEGCLAGHGERTGNVDLITLGLNLFSQGIDPCLDLRNVDHIRREVEACTQMETPARHPYIGDLVYTSFSGSHQDAIKKGFAERRRQVEAAGGDENAVIWELPYLPIDPHDVGRSYEAVVRVNSQSGKGGVAYLMSTRHNLELPRRLQIELSRIVQRHTDTYGGEMDPERLWQIFVDEYLPADQADSANLDSWGRFALLDESSVSVAADGQATVTARILDNGVERTIVATDNGPIAAFVHAFQELGIDVRILDYAEHALSEGRQASAAAYVEAAVEGQILWGVGIDASITRATYQAVISAVNRALRE